MKHLRRISVVGLGLLGGSIALASRRAFSGARIIGYSHRSSTRRKARELAVADEVGDRLTDSVAEADLVILASPISTFEEVFREIGPCLKDGCIVTDVGSTKVLPHRWARKVLPGRVLYAGSHPVAGSEQRGVEFARDDLFDDAVCILTATQTTDRGALDVLGSFWTTLGCTIAQMTPREHDRIFANVSHVPHVLAAALINATDGEELKFAGKGFLDTSRIASGPANIWTDVLLANSDSIVRGIDRTVRELAKLRTAVTRSDTKRIEQFLSAAREKRSALVQYKMRKKELDS